MVLVDVLADSQLGVEDAHAVRSDEVQVGIPGHLDERLLQPGSLVAVRLGEAGGEQRRPADSLLDAVGDDARSHPARHCDQHVVNRFRDVQQALAVFHAELLDAREFVGVDLY